MGRIVKVERRVIYQQTISDVSFCLEFSVMHHGASQDFENGQQKIDYRNELMCFGGHLESCWTRIVKVEVASTSIRHQKTKRNQETN